MTLYLKYRPQLLEDLDLAEVRDTLKKLVSAENLPHAFLFSGPKGTGKTSAARILAKIINCEKRKPGEVEPCNKCRTCTAITRGESLDVIELDAASNRGIDDVRALREAVKLSTAGSNKKVYIIDEAHMLTTEASNALLKTLEEPPDHVVFVLATTNPEKLIETIHSRAVTVNFKRANKQEIVRSLKRLGTGEGLKVDEETLEIIAEAAKGSLRDSHKIFDQIITLGIKPEKKEVTGFLFKTDKVESSKLIKLIGQGSLKDVLTEVENVVESGVGMETYLESLLGELRDSLRAKVGLGEDKYDYLERRQVIELINLLEKSYRRLKDTPIEQLPLEVALVEYFHKNGTQINKNGNNDHSEIRQKSEPEVKVFPQASDDEAKNSIRKNGENIEKKQIPTGKGKTLDDGVWVQVLAAIKPQNTSTEALLRAAKPVGYDGRTLTLGVYYSFHKERLESNQHRILLEKTVETIIGGPVRVSCTLTEPPVKSISDEDKESSIVSGNEAVLTEVEDEEIVKVAKEVFGN
jgi:DNA polymerase III subunit gamma/tau